MASWSLQNGIPSVECFKIDKGTTKLISDETKEAKLYNNRVSTANSFERLKEDDVKIGVDNSVLNADNKGKLSNKRAVPQIQMQ